MSKQFLEELKTNLKMDFFELIQAIENIDLNKS
jgi:hypothetical protein